MEHLPFTVDNIAIFFLMFVRVATIIAFLPIFGGKEVPMPVKIGLSLLLTIVIASALPGALAARIPPQGGIPLLFLFVMKEALVGLTIGFAASFLFAGVQFAARLIDTEIGFGMVDVIDPMNDETVSVVGQLWVLVFTMVLLLTNGHYFFLLAIEKSFEVIPVTLVHFHAGAVAGHFVRLAGDIFAIAIKMSAPIYVALILTEMALGVVARTVPQINIFFVGLPLKIVVGLGATIVAFPMVAVLFRKIFQGLIADIWAVLYMMA